MILPLKHTFSMIIAAPSRAGKTSFVMKLISEARTMITPPPEKIYFCYAEWQPLYETIPDVTFHSGMIDIDTIDTTLRNLIVIDDQAQETDQRMEQLFTRNSHHRNASVIFITQNLFQKNSHMRTMSLNASYLVLFRNPRDVNQIGVLARQMYAKDKSKFLIDAFQKATSKPYGYLFIDLRQETEDLLRIRGGIFPDEYTVIYMSQSDAASLDKSLLNR